MTSRSWLVIAAAAGALSAFAFMGVIAPSLPAIVMYYLSPAPLFMAGLAFGATAALIAALIAAAAIFALLNFKAAAFYLVTTAIAPVILTWLALTSRPAAGGAEGEAADESGREWYPEGRLLLWTSFMGGALMSLTAVMLGPRLEDFRATLRELAGRMFTAMNAKAEMTAEQLQGLTSFVVNMTPLVATILWVLATLGNMWLAARLVRAFGYESRPWAPFWKLTFHPRAMAALAVASFASFLPGMAGLIGEIFAAALMAAFAILGLAVMHALTLGNPWRGMILGVLYAGLLVVNWLIALPLIVLALADLSFGLRARYFARHGGPPAAG